LTRISRARSDLALTLGRPATLDELAAETMMSREALEEALQWRSEPLSLSDPLSEDSDNTLGDIVLSDVNSVTPFDHAATALLPGEICRLLEALDEREAKIIRLRFGLDRGEPLTLEEVGRHFQLTRERIRQIEAKAMSKLRHPSVSNDVQDLVPG
jgi:RNA polymerase sigma factor (sigma-70 family)